MSLKKDTIVQHYKIVSAIGAGGMGEVYLAEDTKLDRSVALKVLLDEVAGNKERVLRFIQEAKAASALNHPNILTVFEVGEFGYTRYIATELIRGETLRERIRSGLGLNEALGIALQVAAALGAAHAAGIVHRDVKPENIMIRDDGLVKVLDFGLAKLTEQRRETETSGEDEKTLIAPTASLRTEPGVIVGTIAYMSPEQARGKKLDARSDIFSFGIVMYELFTGKRPFQGEGNMDLVSSILKDEPAPLRSLAPDLPRQLERIVDKALRKDRDHRYQHIKDLEIDLEDLREELKFEAKLNKTSDQAIPAQITVADQPRPTLTESLSTTRRFTLLHAIIFGIIAASLVGGAWFLRAGFSTQSAIAGNVKITEIANWSSAPGELFSNASFSPDGKLIAFSSTKSASKNIWVTQTASTEAIQVTNDAFSNKDPIWSPKGDEIAFFSQKGNSAGIWRVPALGGTPKSVGAISDASFELRRWTASGKIYYQSNGELHAIDITSGTTQKVTALESQNGKVSWVNISADEKSVAFIAEKEGNWHIFASDAAGNSATEIASGPGEIVGVAWLSEKKRFFYSAMVDGVFQVLAVDGSGKQVRLTALDSDSVVVDAAADGSAIIVSAAKEESTLWRVGVTEQKEAPVSRNVNSELWPAVSPDSTRIAYQSAKNLSRGNKLFESTILVKQFESRDDRPTPIVEGGFLPVWSPDGSTIAFFRRNAAAANNIELMAANPNGGGARVLASGGISPIGYSVSPYNHIQTAAFAWSPDSGRIAYVANRNGASNIWAVSARDGADVQLTNNTGADQTYYCPVWLSDGKKLAFFYQKKTPAENQKSTRGLNVIDAVTGISTGVFETDKIIRFIGWTADENGLIIAESDRQNGLPPETVLKRVAVAGGAETTIVRLSNAYFYNIFLSADRKSIAFAARNNEKDDIWIIPAAGGEPRKLTANNDTGLYFSRLAWLHDGSSIVFGKQTRFSLLSMLTNIN